MPGRVLATAVLVAGVLAVAPAAADAYSIDPQPHVAESAGTLTFTVHRSLSESATPSASVAGSGSSPATPGADVGTPQLTPFGTVDTTTTVKVPIVNDQAGDPPDG